MDSTKYKMLETLKRLKNEHGVVAVKAEFEAEGSRTDELITLNEIVFRADMNLYIKIGGCEAVRDLDQCRLLGASGVMAPMIETPFALKKFGDAINKVYTKEEQKNIEFIINAETGVTYDNFDEIVKAGKHFLNTVTVGRVDLCASIGLTRKEINSDKILEILQVFCQKARNAGYMACFGGGIAIESIPFILKTEEYVSRFETRKIIFDYQNAKKNMSRALLDSIEFEYLYLKNKCDFYDRMAQEDKIRMNMLKERLDFARQHVS